jgi:DNA-binding winged helix-turn-helix (wHTH) protein/tetratricopeptide (TPR) repeat protein
MVTTGSSAIYLFGPYELDPERQMLLRDGEPVAIKPKVFDLLELLVESGGDLLSKDELMNRLWPDQFVEEANLTQSIYELRKLLDGGSGSRRYVETFPRRGYRFSCPVTIRQSPRKPAAAERQIRSIAVLPFTPLSGKLSDESLELGFAETLIAGLSRVPGLIVRPVGSIQRFASGRDPIAAGKELNVEAIVDASIQHSADRLRVTVRIIRIRDEIILWSGKFDQPFTDIFSVEDSICDHVLEALSVEISPEGRSRLLERHTEDAEVHHLFLECRHYWHKWTPENWRRSIECGRKVVERAPGHAPSYSWMAASYAALAITGVLPPEEAFGEAKRLVSKALAIDDTLSEGHEVRGAIELFYEWRWPEAEKALLRSLELNPGNANARDLRALLLIVTGHPEEAVREVQKAREIDPLSLLVNTDAGYINYYARRYAAAIEQLRHTLALDPWFAHARFALGYTLLRTGQIEAALLEFEGAITYSGRSRDTSADLGYALALAGDHSGARQILDALTAAPAPIDPYFPALILVGLDERDAAFTWLEKALTNRSRELIYLRANPIFDHLHGDPRFAAILARVGN